MTTGTTINTSTSTNNEKIHEGLDKMLADPKTKNFLNHLVKSYFPLTNAKKVETRPAGIFKCVLTKEDLFCIEDIEVGLQTEKGKADFRESLNAMLNGKFCETIIGAKKLAVTGKETNTFMSHPAHVEFISWLNKKIAEHDKHITWLVSSIKHTNNPDKSNHNHSNHHRPQTKDRATYTLGDLGVLQKLKETLKATEK